MVARNAKGEVTVFTVSENYNADEILHISIVPARVSKEIYAKAQAIAKQIAEAIHLRGILGVELFILDNGDIYVNELAPRPHNSGHYSIEACNFDQFDIHDRAICNWPLPKIKLLSKVVMVNVLGQHVAGVRKVIPEKSNWHFTTMARPKSVIIVKWVTLQFLLTILKKRCKKLMTPIFGKQKLINIL